MIRKLIGGWLLRRGASAALKTANEVVPRVTNDQFRQVFEVTLPATVFIHASSARVTVRRAIGSQVIMNANLRASFGWQIVAQQDEAGVYIVAKKKPLVGALSSAQFTLTVPPEARLLVQLTPGALVLEDLNGELDIPPEKRNHVTVA